MLDSKFFRELAKDVVPMFRKHTFMDALDVKGKKFKRYSTKYGEAKRSGILKRQATEFANSTAPVLSSDLLRDYKLTKTMQSGFQIGFPTQGGKVLSLAKMGRIISTNADPLPKSVDNFIMKEAEKFVKKKLGKIKGRTFNI